MRLCQFRYVLSMRCAVRLVSLKIETSYLRHGRDWHGEFEG